MYSGAGIGGLALAVTIGKYAERDIQIDIYEAHDAITTAGAGISISPRATEIMQELDMYEEILRISTKPSSSGYGLSKSLFTNLG
jgi:salicylate hydroxylase